VAKWAGGGDDRPTAITPEVEAAVLAVEREAAARGVAYLTHRRLAEAVDLGPAGAPALRHHLVTTRPAQSAWPLWSVVVPPDAP
jgi:hypothetical protein